MTRTADKNEQCLVPTYSDRTPLLSSGFCENTSRQPGSITSRGNAEMGKRRAPDNQTRHRAMLSVSFPAIRDNPGDCMRTSCHTAPPPPPPPPPSTTPMTSSNDTNNTNKARIPGAHLVAPHVGVLYGEDGVRHENPPQVAHGGVPQFSHRGPLVTRGGPLSRLHRPATERNKRKVHHETRVQGVLFTFEIFGKHKQRRGVGHAEAQW